jgi:hypothetical protein
MVRRDTFLDDASFPITDSFSIGSRCSVEPAGAGYFCFAFHGIATATPVVHRRWQIAVDAPARCLLTQKWHKGLMNRENFFKSASFYWRKQCSKMPLRCAAQSTPIALPSGAIGGKAAVSQARSPKPGHHRELCAPGISDTVGAVEGFNTAPNNNWNFAKGNRVQDGGIDSL